MADADVIQEGDQVVFRRESSTRVFQIRKNRQVYFEKSKFDVNDLIGEPYGSTFEIDRGKLVKCDSKKAEHVQDTESTSSAGTDNRNLLDLDSNQKMSKEEIMKMKVQGITGEKIIEALIENSETFHSKTEFSQAKFLKKKKKKHVLVFTVLRPTPRLVMEIFVKEPSKICYLRPDSLSQILSYSNVMSGSRVAVVETCQGLLMACILQRIGDSGRLVQLIPNSTNAVCRQVMDYFGYTKHNTDNVYTYPLDELAALCRSSPPPENNSTENPVPSLNLMSIDSDDSPKHKNKDASSPSKLNKTESSCVLESKKNIETVRLKATTEKVNADEGPNLTSLENPVNEKEGENVGDDKEKKEGHGAKEKEDGDSNVKDGEGCEVEQESNQEGGSNPGEMDNESKEDFVPNREIQRIRRAARQKEAGVMIKDKKLDSLVIACKYNPTPILMKMLKFLPPSRYVVVYCQFLEPLVECYNRVKEQHGGLQLKLSETWMREYQILPQRTHPLMNMSGTGGYLLTFITCDPGNSKGKSSS